MKFLYFSDGNNDAYAYPIEKLQTIHHDTDTTMELYFQSTKQDGDGLDKVNLTLTAGSDVFSLFKVKAVSANTTVELLTAPLVVQEDEILKVQAATGDRLHVVASILEIKPRQVVT